MHSFAPSIVAAFGVVALGVTAACNAATVSGRVTTPDGKPVTDAVVFVQAPEGQASAATARSATMDQVDKTFVPGLLPIVAGTRVSFPNHDQIHHHVYSFSRTKQFELPLYKGTDAPPVEFDKVGVVKVGCNIHDWMSGIILVLPTSLFARTDKDGRFTLENVSVGSHTLVAWHELSKQKPEDTAQTVQVGATPVASAGGSAGANASDVTFRLILNAARPRPAMRGSRREP